MNLGRDFQTEFDWRRGRSDEPRRQAMTSGDLEHIGGGGGAIIKIVVPSLTDEDLTEVVGGGDGPPGSIGGGNGLTGGKASPLLM